MFVTAAFSMISEIRAVVSGVNCASSSPSRSMASVAMIPAPPALAITPTAGPAGSG